METPKIMAVHGIVIAVVAYFIMIYLLKQGVAVAEYRSVLIGLVSTLYMMHFGHGLPKLT